MTYSKAQAARDALWAFVNKDPYPPNTLPEQDDEELVRVLSFVEDKNEFMADAFRHHGDTMPKSREQMQARYTAANPEGFTLPSKKTFHGAGAVAKVIYEPSDYAKTMYKGLFSQQLPGLIRASLTSTRANGAPRKTFPPGVGLKLFDGTTETKNILAIYKIQGAAKGKNFFGFDLTTNPEPPRVSSIYPRELAKFRASLGIFQGALQWLSADHQPEDSLRLPLDELGALKQGDSVPHHLVLRPTEEARRAYQAAYDGGRRDFRRVLSTLFDVDPQMVLYSIQATHHLPGGEEVNTVGTVRLEGSFVSSAFGDQELFFRHHWVKPPKPPVS